MIPGTGPGLRLWPLGGRLVAKKQDDEPRVIRSGICVARRAFQFPAAILPDGGYGIHEFSDGEVAEFKEWSRPATSCRMPGFEVITDPVGLSCHMSPSWFEDKFKIRSES